MSATEPPFQNAREPDRIRRVTSVFARGHTHQANDHGDTLIEQQTSMADHIQVAAARKG
jgi:hypothetical protein